MQEISQQTIKTAISAAIQGAKEVMKVYSTSDFEIEIKTDSTPVTIADKASNEVIVKILSESNIPILSEESAHQPYEIRQTYNSLWVVDPLDGTKEFIKRNGQFSINIALVENCKPTFGVIFIPCSGSLYYGANGYSYRVDIANWQSLTADEVLALPTQKLPIYKTVSPIILGSVSHHTAKTEEFFGAVRQKKPNVSLKPIGSAIKMCMLAEGSAALYPRFGTTMEWDTAAGQAILEQVGGCLHSFPENMPMKYNRKELKNPNFLAVAPNVDAKTMLDIFATL